MGVLRARRAERLEPAALLGGETILRWVFGCSSLVTLEFLSPRWHGDRSLPVWRRGRESFRPPLSAADTKRRTGRLPSAAGWRPPGSVPLNSAGCSAVSEKPCPCLVPSQESTGGTGHTCRRDPGCRPPFQGI